MTDLLSVATNIFLNKPTSAAQHRQTLTRSVGTVSDHEHCVDFSSIKSTEKIIS